jgi:segregation and condensation protein B
MSTNPPPLKAIIEAALLNAGQPLGIDRLQALFPEDERPETEAVKAALDELAADWEGRPAELRQVASGYRFQLRSEFAPWIGRLSEERQPRYSRALLETLALIVYRQPITRAGIEEIRGVSVSSQIIRTLLEREWVRVVGHRDVPGRPALYGTTKRVLDYFNLRSLGDLPPLADIKPLDQLQANLEFLAGAGGEGGDDGAESGDGDGDGDGDGVMMPIAAVDGSDGTGDAANDGDIAEADSSSLDSPVDSRVDPDFDPEAGDAAAGVVPEAVGVADDGAADEAGLSADADPDSIDPPSDARGDARIDDDDAAESENEEERRVTATEHA